MTVEDISWTKLSKKGQMLELSWNLQHLFQVCKMMSKESKTHLLCHSIFLQERLALFSKVLDNSWQLNIHQTIFHQKILLSLSTLISMPLLILNIWAQLTESLKDLAKWPELFTIMNQNNWANFQKFYWINF